jgi:hypothetical protein
MGVSLGPRPLFLKKCLQIYLFAFLSYWLKLIYRYIKEKSRTISVQF